MSLAVVVEQLLAAWPRIAPADQVHLAIGSDEEVEVPPSVVVHRVRLPRPRGLTRFVAQNLALRRLASRIDADVLLAPIPSTAVLPTACPIVVIAHDLRHEQRPHQFSRVSRMLRTTSYNQGFRVADQIVSVSHRTRDDLLNSHAEIDPARVTVAHHGSDHVLGWVNSGRGTSAPYALAFGQYSNKNAHLLIETWSHRKARGDGLSLRLVGLDASNRERLTDLVIRGGLEGLVTLDPWLAPAAFESTFRNASVVVFPSDFEGFGLPVIEGMRLGIPVVISDEAAMLEVSDGHATVMKGWTARDLDEAIEVAFRSSPARIHAAQRHAETFSWDASATKIRAALGAAISKESG